jgi:peptidoglycan/xylan/chitin deacetylase (PgdA/CDA1 family)
MKVGLKRTTAAVLAPCGVLRLGGRAKPWARTQLLLLGYHRVIPLAEGHAGDMELISATPQEFAWQMEYLRERFEPVTFAEIADALDGNGALPKRAVSVTFDDGFADVYEHAFPILRRLAMPATVFVSTGYVDRPQPFWFDLVAWLMGQAPPRSVGIVPGAEPMPTEDSGHSRAAATYTVLKWLKSCDDRDRMAAVEALCAQFPDAVLKARTMLGRPLTWDEIREMSASTVEFGSHTVSHCCLTKVSPEQLDEELVDSKLRLERETRKPVTALAYPFGGRGAFNGTVIEAARRAGYRVATSYVPGVNDWKSADRFGLLRQHVERTTSRAYFEALVNAPEFFD